MCTACGVSVVGVAGAAGGDGGGAVGNGGARLLPCRYSSTREGVESWLALSALWWRCGISSNSITIGDSR